MFSLIINEAGILQKKILQHTGLFTMNILNYIKQTLFKHKEKEYFDTDYLLQFFDGEKTDDKGRYITDYMKFDTNKWNKRTILYNGLSPLQRQVCTLQKRFC